MLRVTRQVTGNAHHVSVVSSVTIHTRVITACYKISILYISCCHDNTEDLLSQLDTARNVDTLRATPGRHKPLLM
jgi:hypothetical protein